MPNTEEILAMNDLQLMECAVKETSASPARDIAISVLRMRVSIKNLEAARELGGYTRELGKYTRWLALATWGIAAITLITQLVLLFRK